MNSISAGQGSKPALITNLKVENTPDDVEVRDDVALVVPNEARTRPSRHLQNVHRQGVPLVDERTDVHHAGRGLQCWVRGQRRGVTGRSPTNKHRSPASVRRVPTNLKCSRISLLVYWQKVHQLHTEAKAYNTLPPRTAGYSGPDRIYGSTCHQPAVDG